MSDIIEEFLAEFLAQDTKEDGFATLVDSEGHPYVANLNPKEKERYEETKKPLSQVKKEKEEKEKQREDAFKKYWEESASASIAQKRKEAEEKKKTEESKKSEQKNTESEKSSFGEKLKKILSNPFKKNRNDSTYHEVDPERIRSVVSKLNPDDPRSEQALNELKKYYEDGQAWAVRDIVNNIDTYTTDPKSYERSLKANERSLSKSLDIFNKVTDKINSLVQNDLKKFTDIMYQRGKQFGSKLSKEQIGERLKTALKEGNLRHLMEDRGFKSEGLRLANKINDMKKSLKNSLENIKNFNPSEDLRWSLNQGKAAIKNLKDDVENYLKANNMAMDSAEYLEIMDLLNQIDFSVKDMAQDSALDAYFDNINLF